MKWPKRFNRAYILLALLSVTLIIFLLDEPFFWDTIQLGAMHGDWFYQQNFETLLLPDHIDSGHIPAFGWYLAFMWQLFGQTLIVSHLAMLPWVFLVLASLYKIIQLINNRLSESKHTTNLFTSTLFGLALFIVDPVFISQLSLISPDVVLIAAFLLSLIAIIDKKNSLLIIGICILGLISMRGVLVACSLFFWQTLQSFIDDKPSFWKNTSALILPYLPGAAIVIAYLGLHWWSKGWIGVHTDSPWAPSFAIVEFKSLFKQSAILIWRILDFGRIFLWLSLILALLFYYQFYKNNRYNSEQFKSIKSWSLLAVILLIVLGTPAIISSGLSQHRYFLPFFVTVSFICFQLLLLMKNVNWKNALGILALLGLFSGNFWIYPDQISQGWDSTMAHKAYFRVKKNVEKFISEENIITSDIGSHFPEIGRKHYRYLNNSDHSYSPLAMSIQNYVLYSNVMNDFSDKELHELKTQWENIHEYRKMGIKMILYKKKKF